MRPVVEPSVTEGAVRSTFPGEHTEGGSVIIRSGLPGVEIITSADGRDVHPAVLVTVKVYKPPGRPAAIKVVPVPAVVTSSGRRVRTHAPDDGNPLSCTLPVGTSSVGCVTVPVTGVEGVAGRAGMTTFAEGIETQPAALATVKLYVPVGISETVVLVPSPVVTIAPE